jgi:hypothetical protein
MKTLKRILSLPFAWLVILIFSQCSEDKTLHFGKTQTGFIADSIYQANSDGFLSVQYSSTTSYGSINGYIYSDVNENPTTTIGMVTIVPGATTVPVQKNNYWKVAAVSNATVSISWVPIQE